MTEFDLLEKIYYIDGAILVILILFLCFIFVKWIYDYISSMF